MKKRLEDKIILLDLAKKLGNVSEACRISGYSRDSFYRIRANFESGGLEALKDRNRHKPNIKNRVDSAIENEVVQFASKFPSYGQARVSNELKRVGISISPAGVRSVWIRNGLETFNKRIEAIRHNANASGAELSKHQNRLLERKFEMQTKETIGLSEGHVLIHDIQNLGDLPGGGTIFNFTYIDAKTRYAFCELYTSNSSSNSERMLKELVLPFYQYAHRSVESIFDVKTKSYEALGKAGVVYRSQSQWASLASRFNQTILNEFFNLITFGKDFNDLAELQSKLKDWVRFYNNERTNQSKVCYGKTPAEVFRLLKEVITQKAE